MSTNTPMSIFDFMNRLAIELNIEGIKGVVGNEIELIALVRNCQHLYDKNVADFKNIQKKNETWEAISQVFGTTVIEVQTRWKTMRDVFGKIRHRYNSDEERRTICPYFDDMKFLEPYIIPRKVIKLSQSMDNNLSNEELINDDDNNLEFGSASTCTTYTDYTLKFIETIKASPALYHRKYTGLSYRKNKIIGWRRIAKDFGMTVSEVLNKWKNLREKYSRERRCLQDGKPVSTWVYFEKLQFLDEHIKQRRRFPKFRISDKVNISDLTNINFNTTSPENSTSDPISITDVKSMLSKQDQFENITFMEVSSDIFDESNENGQDSSASVVSSKPDTSRSKQNYDEDDIFGQSIAAEMKQISCPRKKMKLKADIYALLYQSSCE